MMNDQRIQKINVNESPSLEYRRNNSSSTITNSKITPSPHKNSVNPTYYKISNSVGLENMNSNPPDALKIEERRRKVVIVGDGGIGKTCLLAHYSTGKFLNDYIPTVFSNTHVLVQLGPVIYNVALWDTAGQEDYARLRPLSYPGADAFLLCFAIDQADSFDNIQQKWIKELRHYRDNVPIILVGLKSDLREDPTISEFCVPSSYGTALVEQGIACSYVECSSLTQYNIEKPIEAALLSSDRAEEKLIAKKKKGCRVQ